MTFLLPIEAADFRILAHNPFFDCSQFRSTPQRVVDGVLHHLLNVSREGPGSLLVVGLIRFSGVYSEVKEAPIRSFVEISAEGFGVLVSCDKRSVFRKACNRTPHTQFHLRKLVGHGFGEFHGSSQVAGGDSAVCFIRSGLGVKTMEFSNLWSILTLELIIFKQSKSCSRARRCGWFSVCDGEIRRLQPRSRRFDY